MFKSVILTYEGYRPSSVQQRVYIYPHRFCRGLILDMTLEKKVKERKDLFLQDGMLSARETKVIFLV